MDGFSHDGEMPSQLSHRYRTSDTELDWRVHNGFLGYYCFMNKDDHTMSNANPDSHLDSYVLRTTPE
jgi:hypothetical protein